MKALVTGSGRVHRVAPDRGAARPRRCRSSGSTASPTTTHARSRKRTSPSTPGSPGSSSSSRASRRRISRALLDGVTHVFHLAAQAGVRKSWGRDFRTYTEQQRRCDAATARSVRRPSDSRSSSTRRARRSMATRRRSPCAEDALPRPLSPYGVTKLAAEHLCQLYWANHRRADGVGAVLHGLRTAAAARHGVPPLHHRRAHGPADHGLRRWQPDARLHVRGRRRCGDDRRRRSRRAGAGLQRRWRLARCRCNDVLDIIGASARPSLEDRARRRAEGRRARHVRRHVAGARAISGSPRRCRSNRVSKRSIDGFRLVRARA